MTSIENLLAVNEKVILTANQSRILPGGSLSTPDAIFLTSKRIIFENPRLLGLKKDLIDFMFKDLANVKINKGIFSSKLELYPRFNSEKLELPAIPKKIAEELFKMIRRGINGDLDPVVAEVIAPAVAAVEDISIKLERFANMLGKGLISQEEFQTVKTKLLGEV